MCHNASRPRLSRSLRYTTSHQAHDAKRFQRPMFPQGIPGWFWSSEKSAHRNLRCIRGWTSEQQQNMTVETERDQFDLNWSHLAVRGPNHGPLRFLEVFFRDVHQVACFIPCLIPERVHRDSASLPGACRDELLPWKGDLEPSMTYHDLAHANSEHLHTVTLLAVHHWHAHCAHHAKLCTYSVCLPFVGYIATTFSSAGL